MTIKKPGKLEHLLFVLDLLFMIASISTGVNPLGLNVRV